MYCGSSCTPFISMVCKPFKRSVNACVFVCVSCACGAHYDAIGQIRSLNESRFLNIDKNTAYEYCIRVHKPIREMNEL